MMNKELRLNENDRKLVMQLCHNASIAFTAGVGSKSDRSYEDNQACLADSTDYLFSEYLYLSEKENHNEDEILIVMTGEKFLSKFHNNWVNFNVTDGWHYGSKLSYTKKTSPFLCIFDELPQVEKAAKMVYVVAFFNAIRSITIMDGIVQMSYAMGKDFEKEIKKESKNGEFKSKK